MAGYAALGLCAGRAAAQAAAGIRDHFSDESSTSWMVLPPYPHPSQYPGGPGSLTAAAAAAAMAAGSLHASMGHHHSAVADYSSLASSLQQQQQQQQQRRSPLSSAAYTHSCILEMRKEKSRDAARSRRGKENYEFYELAKMLPLPPAITSQLDKASIIRLTISFLRLKEFSSNGDPPWIKDYHSTLNSNSTSNASTSSSSAPTPTPPISTKKGNGRSRSHQQQQQQQQLHTSLQQHLHPQHHQALVPASVHVELFDQHQGTHILQSLDGFAFSLGSDGRFLYISETVSIYLGLSQVEMTGSSVFDYVHTADHAELAQQLGLTLATVSAQQSASAGASSQQLPPSPASGSGSVDDGSSCMNPDVTSLMSLESNSAYQGLDRSFCIRMKSTLTKRGCHFKSSGYRVVMVLCRLRPQSSNFMNKSANAGGHQPAQGTVPLLGMIAMAIALPPPTVHEVRLEPDMFVTRLSFDLRVVHCEPRIAELIEFVAEDLTGRSLYTLCHAEDVRLLRKAHTDLMHKGQVMTPYYRILNRHGGYTWLQSCATVVCNSKNSDEQSIVCVNYVLSRTEMKNLVVDQCQLESASSIPLKTSGFKTDRVALDAIARSPEESGSENESLTKNIALRGSGSDQHGSLTSDARPSAEDDVDVGVHASEENVRAPKNGRQARSAKRKYEELTSLSGADANSNSHQPPTETGASSESTSAIQQRHLQHAGEGSDHQADETDTARWKRIYAGNMDMVNSQQDRDLDGGNLNGGATDFSTDALLSGAVNKQRSAIQWIGGAPTVSSSGSTSSATGPSALSVPSLLRQLYASRESVIRANVHAAAAAAAGRPTAGYHFANGEGLSSAPGGSLTGNGNDYPTDVFPSSSYQHPIGSGASSSGGGFVPEYLPAMTPPSSVSPRDAAAGALFASAEASLRHYGADSPYVPAALKPHHHVYGHGTIDPYHGHHHGAATSLHHQYAQPAALVSTTESGQFYSHHTPSGFHIYHPQIGGSAASSKASPSSLTNNSAATAGTWYPN